MDIVWQINMFWLSLVCQGCKQKRHVKLCRCSSLNHRWGLMTWVKVGRSSFSSTKTFIGPKGWGSCQGRKGNLSYTCTAASIRWWIDLRVHWLYIYRMTVPCFRYCHERWGWWATAKFSGAGRWSVISLVARAPSVLSSACFVLKRQAVPVSLSWHRCTRPAS